MPLFRGSQSLESCASLRVLCVAALLACAAGCVSPPRARVAPSVVVPVSAPAIEAHPEIDPSRGEFALPASMLDTWNAVGQLLVRTDGVTYEGRAQMLGIYAVRYRGQRFLILTRALVLRNPTEGMLTKVSATLQDGKPNDSVAAIELLAQLQRRLPAEIALIAAGARGHPR